MQRENLYNNSDSTRYPFLLPKMVKCKACFFLEDRKEQEIKDFWNEFLLRLKMHHAIHCGDNIITVRITIEFSRNLCSIARCEEFCKSCSKEFITQIEEKLYEKRIPL